MNESKPQELPQRSARTDNLPLVRNLTAGKYAFFPDVAHSVLAVQGAAFGDGAWAEHRITEPLLRDFFGLLEALQEELNSRWNSQESSGRRASSA
ncbi:hypothetical protein ACW4TU_09730 [Streptomyces sp. QTS52]